MGLYEAKNGKYTPQKVLKMNILTRTDDASLRAVARTDEKQA